MRSIRSKLLRNFLVIIVSTVLILDLLTIVCLKAFYYKNYEQMLRNHIDSSIKFYEKYFSNNKLREDIYDNLDIFGNTTEGQIEVLDSEGNLLMDSYGIRDEQLLSTSDIDKAKKGEVGVWFGKIDSYNEEVMIVSNAITSKSDNDEIIGILRIIYSLKEVNGIIRSFSILFLMVSAVVIVLALIMSLFIARDIVDPIKKITYVAKEMARGNLDIRSNIEDNIEISQLSKTLNYMGQEVEKRERLKNEFISSVSHELRTPLTAIKGWAVTMKYDCSDIETVKLGLDIIEKESDRLTEMVEELLDFSKLINGVISLKRRDNDIKDFIEYIENYMKARAVREDRVFKVTIQNNIGKAFFDENRMKQVLSNIIDNSFKFTNDKGEIMLDALKNDGKLIFIITDNGIGISESDLTKVKEKFYKGKSSKSKNGIGLSISDEIVKLHGGTLEVESKNKHRNYYNN